MIKILPIKDIETKVYGFLDTDTLPNDVLHTINDRMKAVLPGLERLYEGDIEAFSLALLLVMIDQLSLDVSLRFSPTSGLSEKGVKRKAIEIAAALGYTVPIKEEMIKMVRQFKRPFRGSEVLSILNFYHPYQEFKKTTVRSYLKELVAQGMLRKTKWSDLSNINTYICTESAPRSLSLKGGFLISDNDQETVAYFKINVLVLSEVANPFKYLERVPSTLNALFRQYGEIDYSRLEGILESSDLFSRRITLHAFSEELENMRMATDDDRLDLSFDYMTNGDEPPFFAVDGDDLCELFRRLSIECYMEKGLDIWERRSDFPRVPVRVIVGKNKSDPGDQIAQRLAGRYLSHNRQAISSIFRAIKSAEDRDREKETTT